MVRETDFSGAFVRLSVYVGVHAKILCPFLEPSRNFQHVTVTRITCGWRVALFFQT